MRVTFDTNTIEKAARPERCDRNPLHPQYLKVHQAIVDGRIKGFFSETIITLEGIQKADRAAVLGSTTMTQSEQITEHPQTRETVVATIFTVSDPLRQPLHPEVKARIAAARTLGMRLLKAPRLGGTNINDPDGTIFAAEADEAALDARLRLYQSVLRELDSRSVGFVLVKQLALPFTSKNRWTFPIASPIVVDGCTERDQADLKAGCLDRSGPTALGRQGGTCSRGMSTRASRNPSR